ncbi:hypothetical protein F4815DRAFT_503608 [Daldinia loculata]|nr:hypothetical protein F4815DRAFT_503608 [Daldinia loculata]
MTAKDYNMPIPHIIIQDWNDPSEPNGGRPVSSSRKIASGIRTFFRRLWSKRHLSKWRSRKPSSNGEKAALKTDEIRELSEKSERPNFPIFKLATDPRIEAQQFEEFQQYLEEEIAADLALCLGVWQNLTDQLLSQACAPIPPEYLARPSASEIASSARGHSQYIDRTSWYSLQNTTTTRRSELGARIGEGVEHQDGARKRRSRLSHINPAIKAPDPLVGYDMEFPEAKRLPRPKSSKPTRPKYLAVPSRRCRRKRRASAPSLSHTATEYIKPEMPPDSDMEPESRRKSDGLGYKIKVHPYQ